MKLSPGGPRPFDFIGVIRVMENVVMGMQMWRLKGIPRRNLKSRLANKRVKNTWHFGPKGSAVKNDDENVDVLLKRLRFR